MPVSPEAEDLVQGKGRPDSPMMYLTSIGMDIIERRSSRISGDEDAFRMKVQGITKAAAY